MGKNFVHNTGGEVGDIFGFVTDFVTGLCYNETSTKKRPKRTYKNGHFDQTRHKTGGKQQIIIE